MSEQGAATRRMNKADSKRGRISDARWAQILDAAAAIFAEKGYEGTTVRDIADGAGILGGSLYYYISSKEDLLFALIDDFHKLGSAAIDEAEARAVAEDCDAVAVLRAVLIQHVECNATHGDRTAVFHNDFRHLDEDRRQEIVHSRRTHETRLERLLEAGQKEGTVRADLDPRLTALSMLSMLNSIHHWYHPGRGLDPRELGEFQADLLLQGTRTPYIDTGDEP